MGVLCVLRLEDHPNVIGPLQNPYRFFPGQLAPRPGLNHALCVPTQ